MLGNPFRVEGDILGKRSSRGPSADVQPKTVSLNNVERHGDEQSKGEYSALDTLMLLLLAGIKYLWAQQGVWGVWVPDGNNSHFDYSTIMAYGDNQVKHAA